MRILWLTAAVFLVAATSAAQAEKGVVVGLATDTITVKGDKGTVTWKVSEKLLTNTGKPDFGWGSDLFIDVKMGDKVDLNAGWTGAEFLCTQITLCRPDDAGVVTEVGEDTITIRNDKGKTTKYKVASALVNDTRAPFVYDCLYPSKFAEVTKGCRIEVRADLKHEPFEILCLDVKKEQEKDK